ncbi:SDR family NAD(P)-dependent oxidoreductase [Novosphingobium sp.]|uniref:SDR family NAD(P)-dependent oxidoreductase n=1 Tax=Novosphingobium sp. TaxID=1874826 RepID=UPI003D6D2ABE
MTAPSPGALPDAIAVVTGAAGGIGREIVKALKAAGATVIATDLKDGAEIEGADHYLKHDVTSEADWRAVEALVRESYGRLDVLVNNAGLLDRHQVRGDPALRIPPDQRDQRRFRDHRHASAAGSAQGGRQGS